MLISYKRGQTSVVLRVKIYDSSVTTGAGKTGLAYNTSGLKIATIADNEASTTVYTVAGSTVEDITTLGTFATPTATKCRFKEVDSTNHPGVYEIHIANARFAVTSAKSLMISISGATNAAECDVLVPLVDFDPYGASTSNISFAGGVTITQSTTNGDGLSITGNGTGSGVKFAGGTSGNGLYCISGTTSGSGAYIYSQSSSGSAVNFISDSGGGLYVSSGAGNDSLRLTANGGNGVALKLISNGSGAGIKVTPGATGVGLDISGGSTSGAGITVTTTSGNGITVTSGGGNGDAIELNGNGSGHGMDINPGATGNGIDCAGGSTSGVGFNITSTSGNAVTISAAAGNGISVTGTGSGKDGVIIVGTQYDINADIQGNVSGVTAGLDAAGVRSAIGLASANLDTQLTTIDDFLDTEIAAIKAKTDNLPAAPAATSDCITAAGVRTAVGLASANLDTQLTPLSSGVSLATPVGIKKNTQTIFTFVMLDATDHVTPLTGLTVAATRSLDGAAFASCANSVTEISTGIYKITLATTDVNADVLTLRFTATGADDRVITIFTEA